MRGSFLLRLLLEAKPSLACHKNYNRTISSKNTAFASAKCVDIMLICISCKILSFPAKLEHALMIVYYDLNKKFLMDNLKHSTLISIILRQINSYIYFFITLIYVNFFSNYKLIISKFKLE